MFFQRLIKLLGVGPHLLLLGLLLEAVTCLTRRWVSIPLTLTRQAQILLTIPCVGALFGGGIWFDRTLDLVEINFQNRPDELVTVGPFNYVRHPLYATLMITVPPLFVIWFSDLLFLIPWILIPVLSRFIVAVEERKLIETFGAAYEEYRDYVPAFLPFKGAGGARYRRERGDQRNGVD